MSESSAIAVLAEATANRLRLLQRELADERGEDRAAALSQEVKEAISKVVPEQRRGFLEELRTRFPSLDGVRMESAQPADSVPTDPLLMFDRLADQAGSLSAAEKQAVVERLREVGFPIDGPAGADQQDLMEVYRLLQIATNAKPDAVRAAQLLFVLTDFIHKLDQAVWGSWSQVAPDSEIRRNAALQKLLGRFLRGEVTRQQVSAETDRLLRLTASLVVAIQRIAPGLFHQYFDPVSPGSIKEEHAGGIIGKEAKWWRVFEERSATMTPDSFNSALYTAVARFVKDFFQPGGMPAGQEAGK